MNEEEEQMGKKKKMGRQGEKKMRIGLSRREAGREERIEVELLPSSNIIIKFKYRMRRKDRSLTSIIRPGGRENKAAMSICLNNIFKVVTCEVVGLRG